MAKQQPDEEARKKRLSEVPSEIVAPADDERDEDDEDDDGLKEEESQGVSDGDSDESTDSAVNSEDEEEKDALEMKCRGLLKNFADHVAANPKMWEMGYGSSDEGSMDGSRSRSEEDLRDIGSARRLEDDDTADSAWKEAAGPSLGSAPEVVADEGKSTAGAASGSGGDGAEVKGLDDGENSGDDAEETDEGEKEAEEEEKEEEDEGQEEDGKGDENEEEVEEERLGAEEDQGEGEPSASEGGSDSDRGTEGGSTKTSAYSRAFSKILQSKAAKESDTGPVLAARQTLVARKLEEDAGEIKDNKDTRKEKKELREKAHLYPQSFTDTKEKDLVKLATRGVVKLFNAVSKAQKVQASADGRDAGVVAKESKAAFLAEVKGSGTSVGNKRKLAASSEPPFKFGKSESQNQSTSRWSVVKDDFMIGKQKLKDWDKDEEMGDVADEQIKSAMDDASD